MSGWINVKTEAIVCANLKSHSGTEEAMRPHGFKAMDHREWEWTGEGEKDLVVRVLPEEKSGEMPLNSVLKASILARWKTRTGLLIYILNHWPAEIDSLDCSESNIKEIPELLAKRLKTVYASGCTGLTKLDVPEGTYVDASGCTGLKK